MQDNRIRAYARLTARVGANVQKGQGAVIVTQPEACEFARLVAEECYLAGAGWVEVSYQDQTLEYLGYQYQKLSTLCRVPKHTRERQRFLNRELPCEIHILCEDPDGLCGVDEHTMSVVRSRRGKVLKPLRDARENKNQWTIVAVPSEKWAKKVFPDCSEKEAVEKLWDAILSAARVHDEEPEKAWAAHNERLASRGARMSEYAFESVRIQSVSTGTDLRVGLMDEGLWLGGAEKTVGGVIFNPNIPTEEVFTTPKRLCAEGFVAATKPLSFMGQVIDGFSFEFKDGRAVSCRAKRGQALLEKMIALDEDANALGEVALIGKDSPINESGLLFYETLFDENASCHLALGMGFTNTVPGFEAMTREELTARGVNDSVHHTDFMIGADDLRVTGKTRGGEGVCVFENGLWKF